MDANIAFSCLLLRETTKYVREFFPDVKLRKANVYRFSSQQFEFRYDGFYDGCIRATNAYEARSKGWESWLRHKGINL